VAREVPDAPPLDAAHDFFMVLPLLGGSLVSCQVLPLVGLAGGFGMGFFGTGDSYFLDFSPSQAHALRDKRKGLFGSLAAWGWSRICPALRAQ
jgi:hypothetical protein